MRSTLFHVPLEVGGYPIFGFGLLLTVWLIISTVVLVVLWRRQGARFDWFSYLLLVVPVAVVIAGVLPRICDELGLPIRSYGVMMLLAVISATGLAAWRAKHVGLEPETIYSLAFWVFVPGILGARAFYVIEYWNTQFWPAYSEGGAIALLGAMVNVAQGGLVVYGSLIGGALGFVLFVRQHRLKVLPLCDIVAPSLMLGMALGRIGCFLNGCCYGHACEYPWAVTFPAGSPPYLAQAYDGTLPIHGVVLGRDPDGQTIVADLVDGSAAERAGLQEGDRLIHINNTPSRRLEVAQSALIGATRLHVLFELPANAVTEADEPYVNWTLQLDHHATEPIYATLSDQDDPVGGLQLDGLVLSDAPDDGAIVARVRPGSTAARQQIVPGSKLITIQGRPVTSVVDAQRLLSQFQGEPWVQVRTADNDVIRWTIDPHMPRSRPVHPTQLYSSINGALLCLLLLAYAPFRRRDGELIALMLTVYPITRYLIEDIRTDEAAVFGTGLSISQNVSIGVLIAAGVLWWWVLRQQPGTWRFNQDPKSKP